MKKKITKHILIFCMFFLIGCGYKVINRSEINNFYVADIDSIGDRRINYILKNNLVINSKKNSKNVLNLKLNTNKIKEVKEKNIKNQITKYKITIVVEVKFNLPNNEKKHTISSSYNGDYLVTTSYSNSLSKEKKLIENLVENIANDIKNKISSIVNDL